jgi:hypothetical protein
MASADEDVPMAAAGVEEAPHAPFVDDAKSSSDEDEKEDDDFVPSGDEDGAAEEEEASIAAHTQSNSSHACRKLSALT